MSTYKDRLVEANNQNLCRRLVRRELTGSIDKINGALSTNRLYCVVSKNKLDEHQRLNNDHRKCPYLYEAEAIQFTQTLHKTREPIQRCRVCTRALHQLFDIKRSVCVFCSKSLRQEE